MVGQLGEPVVPIGVGEHPGLVDHPPRRHEHVVEALRRRASRRLPAVQFVAPSPPSEPAVSVQASSQPAACSAAAAGPPGSSLKSPTSIGVRARPPRRARTSPTSPTRKAAASWGERCTSTTPTASPSRSITASMPTRRRHENQVPRRSTNGVVEVSRCGVSTARPSGHVRHEKCLNAHRIDASPSAAASRRAWPRSTSCRAMTSGRTASSTPDIPSASTPREPCRFHVTIANELPARPTGPLCQKCRVYRRCSCPPPCPPSCTRSPSRPAPTSRRSCAARAPCCGPTTAASRRRHGEPVVLRRRPRPEGDRRGGGAQLGTIAAYSCFEPFTNEPAERVAERLVAHRRRSPTPASSCAARARRPSTRR